MEEKFYLGYAVVMDLNGKQGYVYSEDDIEDGGWVDLPEEGMLSKAEAEKTLAELQSYCTEKGYKNVTLFVESFEDDEEVEDVELSKGNYNMGDTLSWTYNNKDYSCTGEFYVDKDNNLHHTFVAPSGKEIEIMTPYE